MRQSAFVTGASGFIGRRLCDILKASGCRVVGLDRVPVSGACDEAHVGDLLNIEPWAQALIGADTVFHLAGKVHALSEVRQDDDEYFRINTEGTKNLLKAAQLAKVKRFIFFSTIKAMSRDKDVVPSADSREQKLEIRGEVSGYRQRAAFSEEDQIDPDTPYGKSKLEAEKLVLKGGFVPEPVVLRLCMVYGVGARGNMQKMLHAVSSNRFPPVPEVRNRRSMVHVADVVRAAVLAAEHPAALGEAFVVSDGQTYSSREIYNLMCRALGRPPPNWSIPLWILRSLGQVGDQIGRLRGRRFVFDSDALEKLIGDAWYSSEKIERQLGFKPEWTLEKAMPEMVSELMRR